MKDSIFCSQLLSREKRKLKKSTLKELRRSDLRKLKIKRDLWLKFRERESRFSEKCTKPERMLKSKEAREISSRNTPTLDLQFTPQLPEMVFLLIRKPTSTKSSQRLSPPTKASRSSADLSQVTFSKQKSASRNLNSTSRAIFPGVKFHTSPNWRKPKRPSTPRSSNKSSKIKKMRVNKTSWISLR